MQKPTIDLQDIAVSAIAGGVPLLRAFREYRNLNVTELARLSEVSATMISATENGGSLSFDDLSSIADALEVPAEMLLWHAATKAAGAAL